MNTPDEKTPDNAYECTWPNGRQAFTHEVEYDGEPCLNCEHQEAARS